ncbi:MAG: DUF2829 domain-containing protein [Methanobrevibacter smithii]|nr:MW1434 family type I TA system toxin [Methanobrevibacter smithii]MDD7245170.1 DUF2829 domain-containing protein [Methanobrevibacter smithii]
MKFTEILEELKKGEKVTREEWEKVKTYRYKYIKLEHGDCVAYLKDGSVRHKGEELTNWVGCVFGGADFTAKDWKIYQEKEKNKSWKPKEGDTYFYISGTGKVISDNFMPCLPSDNDKVLFNNAFQTREEAEHMLEKIKIINKLRELSNISFNDNCKQEKFVIFYNTENQQIRITQHTVIREIPFNIYFKNKEDCQKAIEIIGEDNLKKYYFDVED